MKNIFLLFSLCTLCSCYIYRPSDSKEAQTSIEKQIEPQHRYKIISDGVSYKIKAIAWEGDSLKTETIGFKKKTLKFNKNQISSVENRVFSRGRSDALTFTSYALMGGFIYFLTR
ncbi:hypothetical protein ACT4R9_08485 [Ornithobacterium rhinotracheale]|uniref:hypothetical protein n=1 Tax=Ornithobacterium rhinotracheale TaxID=28251 RepID=UPI003FA41AC6